MPTRSSTGTSLNPFDERQPLLKPQPGNAVAGVLIDLEAATRARAQSETHNSWRFFVFMFLTICLNVILALIAKGDEDNKESGYLPFGQSSSRTSPRFDYEWALWRGLGGGMSGAVAMIIQVLTLMVLRTTLNYQHRNNTTTMKAIKTLRSNGSYSRYYQGLTTAMVYRTLARFGDTAANVGILALLGSNTSTGKLPSPIKTIFASLLATWFRIIIAPLDTIGTVLRTEGRPGLKTLRRRVKERGITCLWSGTMAEAAVYFVEHYFWFGTYNYLREVLPKQYTTEWQLSRLALIGLCASLISYAMLFPVVALRMMYLLFHGADTKTLKDCREIIVSDGGLVLFGRGWPKRVIERGIQGAVFAVLWRLFMGLWNEYTGS